jgi:hypothetical protein
MPAADDATVGSDDPDGADGRPRGLGIGAKNVREGGGQSTIPQMENLKMEDLRTDFFVGHELLGMTTRAASATSTS